MNKLKKGLLTLGISAYLTFAPQLVSAQKKSEGHFQDLYEKTQEIILERGDPYKAGLKYLAFDDTKGGKLLYIANEKSLVYMHELRNGNYLVLIDNPLNGWIDKVQQKRGQNIETIDIDSANHPDEETFQDIMDKAISEFLSKELK